MLIFTEMISRDFNQAITIRLAQISQMPALRAVAIRSYEDTFASSNTRENLDAFYQQSYPLARLEEEFYETGASLYVACQGEELVGFLRLRESQEAAAQLGNHTIELQRLYIDTPFHGHGIGNKLMEKALAVATENNYDWIWLGVWEKNFNAQRFYARYGFERFGEHIFQMGDDPQTDWLLKKKL